MLEKLQSQHLDLILGWRNEPSVRRCMFSNEEITAAQHTAWFRSLAEAEEKLALLFYFDSYACGVVQYSNIHAQSRRSSWGFYLSQTAPALATLALEVEALDYAFDVLGLHSLNCEVIEFNKKVINLHLKCGFTEDGKFRDYHFDGNKFHNVVRLSMLEGTWAEGQHVVKERLRALRARR